MSQEFMENRRKALEESFFAKRNAELLEKLKKQVELESKRNELAMVSGINDKKLLDRLVSMDLGIETVAALALVPMVRVAWADGKLEESERTAVLDAAVKAGLQKENPSYHWLLTWLDSPPDEQLAQTWTEYVQALMQTIGDDDKQALRDGLLKRTREVAAAAGSILGLTNPISEAEEKVLKELSSALE